MVNIKDFIKNFDEIGKVITLNEEEAIEIANELEGRNLKVIGGSSEGKWIFINLDKITENTQTTIEVPLKTLVNFNEYKELLKDRNSHLEIYEKAKKNLALEGQDYEIITKALCYYIESLRQTTLSFNVGVVPSDNRIHFAVILPAGRGKGQIRKLLSMYNMSKYERVLIFPATRTNPEQLIGRYIAGKKGEEKREERGYLNYKGLVVDECQDLLAENERNDSINMLELRNGSEVWHKNTIQKKLTSDDMLSYDPEFRALFLLHYPAFPPVFFDRGMARRLFVFQAGDNPIPASAGYVGILEEPLNDNLSEYINTPVERDRDLKWSKEGKIKVIEFIKTWNDWSLMHTNQRIRALAQRHFTSIKDHFIRVISILSLSKREETVSIESIIQGGLDTIEFLLSTFEIFANRGSVNLSRDIWQSTDIKEAMLFEWMFYNRALSESSSNISIFDVQQQIGYIWGLMDRQARGIFSRLVESGLIGRKQIGNDASKAWLGFEPKIEGGVKLIDETGKSLVKIDLKEFISNKLLELENIINMENGGSRVARVADTDTINNINKNNNNNLNYTQLSDDKHTFHEKSNIYLRTGMDIATLATPPNPPSDTATLATLKNDQKTKELNLQNHIAVCPVCGKETARLWEYDSKYYCLDCMNDVQSKGDDYE
jgi:hypothetical protein